MNLVTTVIAAAALAGFGLVLAETPAEAPKEPEEELHVYWAELPVANQAQLEEKLGRYWRALLRSDYRAVYDMYPPYARSVVSYSDWLSMHGIKEEAPGTSEYELVSTVIEGIRCTDDPNFSNLFEVFTRLRIQSREGDLEEGVESNVWELDDDGTWYPSLPMMPSH